MDASYLSARHGPWAATRQQVNELERALPAYVISRSNVFSPAVLSQLQDYRRKYIGLHRDGRPWIAATFFSPRLVSRRDWLKGVIIDGMSREDNWSVLYDPSEGTFTEVLQAESPY